MVSDIPSAELLPVLSNLRDLKHILLHLSKDPYHATIHKFASLIDEHLYEKVLQKGTSVQFKIDLVSLESSLGMQSLLPQCLTFLESIT